MMNLSYRRDKLREIERDPSPKTLLVIVPGVGTALPDTWLDGGKKSWLQFLPDKALPSPAVYQFDHNLGPDMDSRLWRDILNKGLDLMDALVDLRGTNKELRQCAIVFIAHSLGGIIVKQCLTKIFEKSTDLELEHTGRTIAAFVAIATPHSRSSDPKHWNQPQLIVGAKSRTRRARQATAEDLNSLGNLCIQFEALVTNVTTITLCEKEETPIKSILVRASKVLIVPEYACQIRSRLEEFIQVDANHMNICNMVAGATLEKKITEAVAAVLLRIKGQEDPPPAMLGDLQALGENPPAVVTTQATHPTNEATDGTSNPRKDGATSLVDFTTTKRDPILPCYVPGPFELNGSFCGRSEILEKMEDYLIAVDSHATTRRDVKSFAICGPGGIGKTQVANQFAAKNMNTYEAIFWVQAEKETTLADQYSFIAEKLGLVLAGTADANDQIVTRELVRGWLEKPMRSYNGTDNSTDEVSWLLIFDNVNNFDILADFWPQHGNSGSIIVTSREHVVKMKTYHIEEGIDLPPLKKEEASNLLLKLTWHEDIPEEQELSLEVAEILGGLPLAMTQMAGVMNRKSLSSADFLNRYKEEESRQELFSLSLEPKIRRTTYGHTLATVWALEELKHSSGLLDVMSYLDPGGIYELYLQDAVGNVQLSDYPKTTTAYQDARSELLDSSLVNRSTDRFHKSSLTIHRLIQDGARAKMSPERAEETFSAAVEILCLQWPAAQTGVRHHIARWQECEKLSPHILRLKDRFAKAGSGFRSRWITNLSFATILNELGWYFQERGYTDQAVECYEIARTNVEHIINTIQRQASASQTESNNIDKPSALLAEVHNNLAGAATEFNDGKTALHHFTIYNKMQLDSQGAKSNTSDSRLTSSFFNLGLSYAMTEDYDQAILSFEQAMVEASKLLEPTRIKIARSLALINLGLTRWLMGAYTEASETLERALAEREELLGKDDRQSMITGRILHCLGNVRHSQGLPEESLGFHERALRHFKETVGNNHHRTGNSCFKVAEHYVRLERLDDACELLEQACKIFDRHRCYNAERGRVALLQSVISERKGKVDDSQTQIQQARSLYQTLIASSDVSTDQLTFESFAKFVHVWGR